jgi:ribonuclease HI
MDKKPQDDTNKGLDLEKGSVKLMWIPNHSGMTGNDRADEVANNALEKDINEPTTKPNQLDEKGRKHHEIQEGNYRVEVQLNQPKQKGVSGGIQRVHTSNT